MPSASWLDSKVMKPLEQQLARVLKAGKNPCDPFRGVPIPVRVFHAPTIHIERTTNCRENIAAHRVDIDHRGCPDTARLPHPDIDRRNAETRRFIKAARRITNDYVTMREGAKIQVS